MSVYVKGHRRGKSVVKAYWRAASKRGSSLATLKRINDVQGRFGKHARNMYAKGFTGKNDSNQRLYDKLTRRGDLIFAGVSDKRRNAKKIFNR